MKCVRQGCGIGSTELLNPDPGVGVYFDFFVKSILIILIKGVTFLAFLSEEKLENFLTLVSDPHSLFPDPKLQLI